MFPKLLILVTVVIASIFYFLYSSWPVKKLEMQSAAVTPVTGTAPVSDWLSALNNAAVLAQDCTSESINPFRKGMTNCSAEEGSKAVVPLSASPQETSGQKKITTTLTTLSDKFDQFQKNTDPESLSSLIIMADECQKKSMGEKVSESNSCAKVVGKRQAAQEALAQASDSGNPAAQYLYGMLLQVNATSGLRMSQDPAIRAADYKRGEVLIRRAADAGDAQAKSTVRFYNSIQKDGATAAN